MRGKSSLGCRHWSFNRVHQLPQERNRLLKLGDKSFAEAQRSVYDYIVGYYIKYHLYLDYGESDDSLLKWWKKEKNEYDENNKNPKMKEEA